VGDCLIGIIRRNELVYRSSEQQHRFNYPFQLGPQSLTTPVKDAFRIDLPVQEGDVIVLATDGLGDNLWDEDMLEEAAKWGTDVRGLSEALAKRAKRISEIGLRDGEARLEETPFARKAAQEGGRTHVGGKQDGVFPIHNLSLLSHDDGTHLGLGNRHQRSSCRDQGSPYLGAWIAILISSVLSMTQALILVIPHDGRRSRYSSHSLKSGCAHDYSILLQSAATTPTLIHDPLSSRPTRFMFCFVRAYSLALIRQYLPALSLRSRSSLFTFIVYLDIFVVCCTEHVFVLPLMIERLFAS
jgi:hypothetical protein